MSKNIMKATQELHKAKKWNFIKWPGQVNTTEHAFLLLKTKLNAERPTKKQWPKKDLADHYNGGNLAFSDVHGF